MSYTMLIADDEEIERKALKMMLENSIPELKVTAEAQNGIELLKLIRKAHFDIMIVDVDMPVLSGLEALSLAREELKDTKIIMYTAYSNFDYAQMAIKCHADDYILKPAKRERFVAVITKCLDEIKKEKEQAASSEQLKDIIHKIRPMIEDKFMNLICSGDGDDEKIKMYMDALNLKEDYGCIVTFSVEDKVKSNEDPKRSFEQIVHVREAVKRLKESVSNIVNNAVVTEDRSRIICFIPIGDKNSEYRNRVKTIEAADVMIRKTEVPDNITITAGIGSCYDGIKQLYLSYRESLNALHNTKTKLAIRHYNDLFGQKANVCIMQNERKQILNAIINCNKKDLENISERVFFYFRNASADILDNWVIETVLEIVNNLGTYMAVRDSENFTADKLLAKCTDFNDAAQVKAWFFEICETLTEAVIENKNKNLNAITDHAQTFIRDNYYKDISLEDVARECNVSTYYLSRMFKDKVGENYTAYLTKIRMEAAMGMIEKYDYPVKVLAEKTGFNNTGYFCKVFKNYTGHTVSEYKELL